MSHSTPHPFDELRHRPVVVQHVDLRLARPVALAPYAESKALRSAIEAAAMAARETEVLDLLWPDHVAYPNALASPLVTWVSRGDTPDAMMVETCGFGRRAVEIRSKLGDVLSRAGAPRDGLGGAPVQAEHGLHVGAERVPFHVVRRSERMGTLAEMLDDNTERVSRERAVCVELETPCVHPDLRVAVLAADAAHALARVMLASETAPSDRSVRDRIEPIADALREQVLRDFDGTAEVRRTLGPRENFARTSASSGKRFKYYGVRGTIRLEGDLARCAPWLALLSLWGAGGRRAMGMGRVRLSIPLDGRDPSSRDA